MLTLIMLKKYQSIVTNVSNVIRKKIQVNSSKLQLGRWNNENFKKTKLKIDWANEDHCGVCSGLLVKNNNK